MFAKVCRVNTKYHVNRWYTNIFLARGSSTPYTYSKSWWSLYWFFNFGYVWVSLRFLFSLLLLLSLFRILYFLLTRSKNWNTPPFESAGRRYSWELDVKKISLPFHSWMCVRSNPILVLFIISFNLINPAFSSSSKPK